MTVAETESMGKAAELLSISQSSVSKAIAEIEHTIGVRLLDRTPKGVAITAYGRALLRRGIGAFHELRQSIKDIELLSDPMAGDVQIGCPEAIACGLLLAILDRFSSPTSARCPIRVFRQQYAASISDVARPKRGLPDRGTTKARCGR